MSMGNQGINNSNKLWIARKKAGLSQKSVARLLGYHCTSPISEYENGRLHPNLRTALKLSIIYKTPLPQLFTSLYDKAEQEIEEKDQNCGVMATYDCDNQYAKDPLTNPHPCY